MIDQNNIAPRKSVLVVDDTADNLRLLASILSEQGYSVRPVPDGNLAILSAQTEPPDLILLDIMMPNMNGYDVCEKLKADERTRSIPIIFISALNEVFDKVKAFNAGGVDYITKPFQVEEVVARVGTHLTLRSLQQELEQANRELEQKVHELQKALAAIQTLSGLVPICAWCGRKIRDENDNWLPVESYVEERTEVKFSHGICPDCLLKFKDEIAEE